MTFINEGCIVYQINDPTGERYQFAVAECTSFAEIIAGSLQAHFDRITSR